MQDFWTAFLSAQSSFRDPCKDTSNPHFKSRFVSLKGVADAVRPALHKAGITVTQLIDFEDGTTFVRTVLAHTSGQSIDSRCPVVTAKQNDPQAMGSAITYARRYALAAICGVAPSDDDDDGEGAVEREPVKVKAKQAAPPKRTFASPEAAGIALGKCVEQKHVDTWETVAKDSGFMLEELASLLEASKERRAVIAEQNNNNG
jgi:hypothetical protein